jgi:ABC-2 type transport system ATP-binding protein
MLDAAPADIILGGDNREVPYSIRNGYAVETRNLTKRFGHFTALDNLDLKIEAHAVHGLLGPNGAGKTTAIKLLCGLLKPTAGEAYILGKKVPDRSLLPQIGYMPQETALYLDLTVHHNLSLYGELYGLTRKRIAEREKDLLRFIALEKWRDSLVANLSGGMKHRVSLACSMIHEPKLLFLDEPTVGVDPELRASFWEYFNGLQKAGVTIVLTTHYMDEAQHCDKIGLIRRGRLIADGTPGDIVKRTNTTNLEDAFLALAGHQAEA